MHTGKMAPYSLLLNRVYFFWLCQNRSVILSSVARIALSA